MDNKRNLSSGYAEVSTLYVRLFFIVNLLIYSGVVAALSPAIEAQPDSMDANALAIMQEVDRVARQASDGSFSVAQLLTCKFGQKPVPGKAKTTIGCVEQPRVKKLESIEKHFGRDKKDTRSVAIILEPASERGIGMLTYQYDEVGLDTESWLYLSALGKVKRLVSGSDEEQEPVSFFGSEFTTEDMETGNVEDFTYRIVKEGNYKSRPVVMIEASPKPFKLRKSRYSRSLFWIDRERYLVLKREVYDKRDQLLKKMQMSHFQQIKKRWVSRKVMVVNVQSQRLSRFELKQITMDIEVPNGFLTQRTLTDVAFRERLLEDLRAQAK